MSRIKVDRITNRAGTGDPLFPNGISVVGLTSLSNVIAGVGTFSNVTIGGTITYDDVTNVDSTGIVTAKSGIKVGNPSSPGIGVTIDPNGNAVFAGILTATTFSGIDTDKISEGNTEVEVVDTGSDGHVKMTTEGGERVRVGPAGQIGLGGANYGTSGQVLTSAGSGSAPSWSVVPPGGNVITAEAEGAIAADKCVQIRTDGKVEQIAESSTPAGPGNTTLYPEEWIANSNSDNMIWSVTVCDPDANRAVAYFQGTSDRISFTNLPNPTSGGLGPRTQVYTKIGDTADYTIDNGRHSWGACYDTTNDKHVVVWSDTSSSYLRCSVGTMSGATLSFNTQTVLQSTAATLPSVVFDSATGRVIVVCRRSDNWYPQCFVGSYNSGTGNYDWSSMTQLSANAMTADIRICKAGTTTGQYAVFWRQNSNNYVYSNLITVSSSTNTFTNAGLDGILESVPSYWIQPTYDATADRINMVYFNNSNSQVYVQRVKRKSGDSGLEVDGTAVNVVVQNAGKDIAIAYSPQAGRCYIWWRDPSYGGGSRWRIINNTTGTITMGGETNPGTNPDMNTNGLGLPDIHAATGNIIFTIKSDATDRGRMFAITTTTITSNLVHQNHYLGYADQAYTDGQTATIKTYGNNIDTLTGLTPGTLYYVQGDGSIATSTDGTLSGYFLSGTPVAGTALSATKLLIRDPTTRST